MGVAVDGTVPVPLSGTTAFLPIPPMPLGMLFFGPLSDVVRIEWMLVATGLMIAVQAVFLRFDRALLTAGEPLAGTKMKEDVIE